jgi:malonyl-CoA O-methyltransferase
MAVSLHAQQQQFDRRAARLGQHDALLREIDTRLQSRLDLMRLSPTLILDVGCGSGASRTGLLERYPHASWIGVDLSPAMLRAAKPPPTFWNRVRARLGIVSASDRTLIAADAASLPLPDGSVDLVFSNLMLHWHAAPHVVIQEWARVLSPGGLLLFSSYGPDTLGGVRTAAQTALPRARPVPFVDMHDLGDMLMAAGFEAPVMEREPVCLQFDTVNQLLAEVRALGGNPRSDRANGLPSGAQARALYQQLDRRRSLAGSAELEVEVVIGHGWRRPPVAARAAQQVLTPATWNLPTPRA